MASAEWIIQFALLTLAVHRVSLMIAAEDGPFDIFSLLRGWVQQKAGRDSWLAEGIECRLCISFWLSWAIAIATQSLNNIALVALAMAGVISILPDWSTE